MLHASPSDTTMRRAGEGMRMRAAAPQNTLRAGDFGNAAREQSQIVAGNQALLRAPGATQPPAMLRPSRAPVLQRKCACGGSSGVSGQCTGCREEKESVLHQKATGEAASEFAPPIVHQVLGASGAPLDAQTRAFMEPRFGQDLGAVRVHTDAMAAQSAAAVNAQAYTVGRDIVFASGRHAPHSGEGRALLAHELAHVVQQGGRDAPPASLRVAPADDPLEHEAKQAAQSIGAAPVAASHAEPAVQRQTPEEKPSESVPTSVVDPESGRPADPFPPDQAAQARARQYICAGMVDPTKPKTRPFTAEEAITVENALHSAKDTIALAISNLARRNPFHLAAAADAFKQPVTFEKILAGFTAIQNGLNKLKTGGNLIFGTCDDKECNPYPSFAVAYTQDDLSGVVACTTFFTKSALVQATTMLHEAGHVSALDPHFTPGNEHYCRKDVVLDCEDICPIDDGNMLENVDAWSMLAYCVATVSRRDLQPLEKKSSAADLRQAQDLVSRAYGNLGRHDPYHLTLAQRTFGTISAADVDAKVLAIKTALAGIDADKDTTGATADDAGARLGLVAYTLENGTKLVLCPGYFAAPSLPRQLSFLMHAGYRAGIAAPKGVVAEICGPETGFDCSSPCAEGLNPPDPQTHVSDAKNDKSVGAWARFISCVGSA
jgi:hypothetical protein